MSEHEPTTDKPQARKGLARRAASTFFPIRQTSAIVRKPFERLKGTITHFKESIFEQSARAGTALKQAPHWETIEELEHAWGVTDANRAALIKRFKLILIGQSALLVLVLLSLVSIDTRNIVIFVTSALVVLSAVACILVYMATALWRLHVLSARDPVNFVQWLKGHSALKQR